MKGKSKLALVLSAAALTLSFLGAAADGEASQAKPGKEVGFTVQANGDLAIENPGHEFLFRNARSFHVDVESGAAQDDVDEIFAIGGEGVGVGSGAGGFFAGADGSVFIGNDTGGSLALLTSPARFDLLGGTEEGTVSGLSAANGDVEVGEFDPTGNITRGVRTHNGGTRLEHGGTVFELGDDGIIRLTRGPQTAALGFGVENDPEHFRINAEETIVDAQAISLIGGEGGGGLFINRNGSVQVGGSSLHARVNSPAGPNGFDVEDHGMAKFGNGNGEIVIHSDGAFQYQHPLARFLLDSAGRFELFTLNDAGRRNGLKTIHTGNVLLGQFENDGNFSSGLDVDAAGNGTYRGPSFHVDGTFSTSGPKPFRIPHPSRAGSELWHAAIESPRPMNAYSGNVVTNRRGFAVVRLPAYFDAINRDFRYQLTVVGRSFAQAIVWREIAGNRFTIRTDRPSVKVSWQVTAVRDDAYMRAHPFETERKAK